MAQGQTSPTRPPAAGSFDDVMRAFDLKAKVAPAPDFVVKSRPDAATMGYIPVGARHPDRTVKTLSPAEVAAATADLDATRAKQQRRAGIKPPAVPDKAKKAAPMPPAPVATVH